MFSSILILISYSTFPPPIDSVQWDYIDVYTVYSETKFIFITIHYNPIVCFGSKVLLRNI